MAAMSLLAIDPGYTKSAWLLFSDGRPCAFGIEANEDLLQRLAGTHLAGVQLAIESVASYGMAVGAEVFETCVWSGRLIQRWEDSYALKVPALRVYRRDVKLHICGSMRAKDANVRQALIDRYGPGKDLAIGRKATPGPLFGITSHVWAALGVAVTASETMLSERAAA
ncbi:MAG: hypothetical protein WKF96_01265 [Solirubrobacteraceae bacterium]